MSSLFSEAITVMVFGMGFVFVFLTLLVFATTAMSKTILKYFPEPQPTAAPVIPVQQSADVGEDRNVHAVVALAVAKYRAKHKR